MEGLAFQDSVDFLPKNRDQEDTYMSTQIGPEVGICNEEWHFWPTG